MCVIAELDTSILRVFFGYVVLGAIISTIIASRAGVGSPLVLKSWKASDKPDADGNFIVISGRRSGILGWFLAVIGIDPVTTIKVSAKLIEFSSTSISGNSVQITPLCSVSSSFFGYRKPWFMASLIGLIFGTFASVLLSILMRDSDSSISVIISTLFFFIFGSLAAFLYFKFNRTQTIGFFEIGGKASGIQFRPSLIEGINVDENQAKYAANLMQFLIQTRLDR